MIYKDGDAERQSQVFRRYLIRETLRYVAEKGLPGKHHFYIAFQSNHPDVQIPDFLKQKYSDYIGVILQYQFEDLVVQDDFFEVTLSFQNIPARIHIPYNAILSFEDPSVRNTDFMRLEIKLTPELPASFGSQKSEPLKTPKNSKEASKKQAKGEVITFHDFRKK